MKKGKQELHLETLQNHYQTKNKNLKELMLSNSSDMSAITGLMKELIPLWDEYKNVYCEVNEKKLKRERTFTSIGVYSVSILCGFGIGFFFGAHVLFNLLYGFIPLPINFFIGLFTTLIININVIYSIDRVISPIRKDIENNKKELVMLSLEMEFKDFQKTIHAAKEYTAIDIDYTMKDETNVLAVGTNLKEFSQSENFEKDYYEKANNHGYQKTRKKF